MAQNSHAISAIRKRLAEVSGELIAVEKRWLVLREEHHTLSQTLRMFDPEADASQIKPKRPYRRAWPRDKEKLSRLVLDALRACGRPMTTDDLVTALGDANGIPDIHRRVRMTLARLSRSSRSVTKEGERGAVKWSLALSTKRGLLAGCGKAGNGWELGEA